MAKAPAKPPVKASVKALKEAGNKSAKHVPFYSFRIELASLRPKIWRYFFTPSNISLADFHEVIQKVMGWFNCHLYSFTIFGEEYFFSGDDEYTIDGEKACDPSKIKLNRLGLSKGAQFEYIYDMGDSWEHVLKVLDTDYVPAMTGQKYGCFKGAMACPPEDCGGPYGYQNLLEILADPDHEEHEEMMEWTGGPIDPKEFDLELINRMLRSR
ncbi:MAG: plasmid pRiA4b ORF-3 family protein [Deltaproteobacteria bacterium]|jgi:hypothetical protein|nr:plasmid pRiA4b ORF-3 family protein [Deltaproteobacteria bacterium]